jgi:hypothetical protein
MRIGHSDECSKSELDLFTIPPTQTSIEEGFYDNIEAPSSFEKSDTIRLEISGDSRHYLNLSETELHIEGRICKKSDTSKGIEDTTKIGPVNNFLHSLFSQIEISINNTPIENTNTTYPYKAYLNNLLGYNELQKKSFLFGDKFSKDTSGYFNNVTVSGTELKNNGLIERRKPFLNNKPVQLQGKLHCDIFNLNHYMINSVSIQIKLTKSNPKFYLIGDVNEEFMFYYDALYLRIRRQVISPSVMAAHTLANEQHTFKYPLKRVVLKNMVIPHKSNKFTMTNVCQGVMPRRVLCALVKTSAFDGSLKENPFEFLPYDVTYMALKINSKSLPYSAGLDFDYDNNKYVDGYRSLLKICRELDITYEEFKAGYAIYAFDLNPDICSPEHYSLLEDGNMDLDIRLSKYVEDSLTFIFYLEYDNILEINKHRNVTFDYTV